MKNGLLAFEPRSSGVLHVRVRRMVVLGCANPLDTLCYYVLQAKHGRQRRSGLLARQRWRPHSPRSRRMLGYHSAIRRRRLRWCGSCLTWSSDCRHGVNVAWTAQVAMLHQHLARVASVRTRHRSGLPCHSMPDQRRRACNTSYHGKVIDMFCCWPALRVYYARTLHPPSRHGTLRKPTCAWC